MLWRPHSLGALLLPVILARAAWAEAMPSLPEALRALPADTPVAMYVPRAGDAVRELAALWEWLRPLDERPGLAAVLPELLDVLTSRTEGTRADSGAGIDLEGELVVRIGPSLESAVIDLPLMDAERFRRWLLTVRVPSRGRSSLYDETVEILAPDSEWPVGCLIRDARALCQLGAPEHGASPLVSHLRRGGSRLGRQAGLAEAWSALSGDARWTMVIRPTLFGRALVRSWGRSLQRGHRLHGPEVRARVAREAGLAEQTLATHLRLVEAIAVSGSFSSRGRRVEVVVRASPSGVRRLGRWLPARPEPDRIFRWASTPGLLNVFLQADPELSAELARWAGVPLPVHALAGSMGLLTLGVDVLCPQARAARDGPLDWAFLFPSAVVIGLRDPRAAGEVHAELDRRSNLRAAADGRATLRPGLAAGPVELRVVDDLLVGGTGPMSTYAALRRLRTLDEEAVLEPPGFLHVTLDLEAIDTALAAGTVGGAHRRELRDVEDLRRRLTPLAHSIRRISLTGLREGDAHVRLVLTTNP